MMTLSNDDRTYARDEHLRERGREQDDLPRSRRRRMRLPTGERQLPYPTLLSFLLPPFSQTGQTREIGGSTRPERAPSVSCCGEAAKESIEGTGLPGRRRNATRESGGAPKQLLLVHLARPLAFSPFLARSPPSDPLAYRPTSLLAAPPPPLPIQSKRQTPIQPIQPLRADPVRRIPLLPALLRFGERPAAALSASSQPLTSPSGHSLSLSAQASPIRSRASDRLLGRRAPTDSRPTPLLPPPLSLAMTVDEHPAERPSQPQALEAGDPSLPKAVLYWCGPSLSSQKRSSTQADDDPDCFRRCASRRSPPILCLVEPASLPFPTDDARAEQESDERLVDRSAARPLRKGL